jgi:Tol biopolymer transport system component
VGVFSAGSFPIYGRAVEGPNFLLGGVDGIRIFNVYTATSQTVGHGFYASYSSDGSQIVANQGKNIFTMNSDGSNVHTIYSELDSTKAIAYPQFSPDGRYVVFQTLWSVTLN